MNNQPKQERLLWTVLKNDLTSYLSETTVHGFRYVTEGRTIFERLIWVLFIALGFGYSIIIISEAFESWKNHPVETTISEVSVPVQELPFPAITVCDTESLQMPRRNRWMFLEKLLNAVQLKNPEKLMKSIYPGRTICSNYLDLVLELKAFQW